jgi:hypothetical protein
MRIWQRGCIVAVAVLATGAARLPIEAAVHRELRDARLMPPPLEIGTGEKIGQTSRAVALGGLRTLVATFLNLRAFTFFTEQKWGKVDETFRSIVDLAPRTRYYWETGAWHQSYNAASYYINDSKLPNLRRREAWRASIQRGRNFLERGIRNNPDDWRLQAYLGFMLSDPNKIRAFPNVAEAYATAAEAYAKAAKTGQALPYVRRAQLYSLARVPGREAEALALCRQLYSEGRSNHTPTLLSLLLVLESNENPASDPAERAIGIFGTAEKAYENLSSHWQRSRDQLPIHGVARALEGLEKRLAVPAENSILNQPLPPPPDLDVWFGK